LLWHTSNIYYIKPQGKAAELISALSFPGKTFFCNSGAEANEAAIKLCRKWGNQISPNKTKILSLTDSFHGRTMASITLTGQPKYQKGFSPLPPDFDYIETNNIKELENAINENTAALFVEAIQGEGGIRPLSAEFLEKARELTKKHNALLIFDEVQTGAGRTGKPFAYQHFDIEPDAITLAKGLGNGIPIGALHVRDQYTLLEPGEHASTFGGNFLATSVAVEVLKILQKKTFFEKVAEKSNYLEERLKSIAQNSSLIQEVRGLGFMWGIVTPKAAEVYRNLFQKKILTTNIKNEVIRILPPLVAGIKEIDFFADQLEKTLEELK
jgi:acetylornithine/succinyldiaminopimelate/putrescine aminotransferase